MRRTVGLLQRVSKRSMTEKPPTLIVIATNPRKRPRIVTRRDPG